MEELKSFDDDLFQSLSIKNSELMNHLSDNKTNEVEIDSETQSLIDNIFQRLQIFDPSTFYVLFSNLNAIIEENKSSNIAVYLNELKIIDLIVHILQNFQLSLQDDHACINLVNSILCVAPQKLIQDITHIDYIGYLFHKVRENVYTQYIYNYGLMYALFRNSDLFQLFIDQQWFDCIHEGFYILNNELENTNEESSHDFIYSIKETMKSLITLSYVIIRNHYVVLSPEHISLFNEIFIQSLFIDFCRSHSVYALYLSIKSSPDHNTSFLLNDEIIQQIVMISSDSNQNVSGCALYIIWKILSRHPVWDITVIFDKLFDILTRFQWVELTKPVKYTLKIMMILSQNKIYANSFFDNGKLLFFENIINDMEFKLKTSLLSCLCSVIPDSCNSFMSDLFNHPILLKEILSMTEEEDLQPKLASKVIASIFCIIQYNKVLATAQLTLEELQELISKDFLVDYADSNKDDSNKAELIINELEG